MTEAIQSKIKRTAPVDETVPTFIKKTYDILEDRKFPEIIDWNAEGTALIIKKPTEFCKKVLPVYFKHNNLTSFIRQLNMYDFHKRRTQDVDHIYCHDLFQKGKRHLLKEIKRKNNEHFHTLQKTIDTIESIQNTEDNSGATYENLLLKKLNKDSLSRIAILEKKMKDLTIQNQALWNQIYGQNEREEVLKAVLTNLLKHIGISISQLPLLLKHNPILLSSNKSQEEHLMNELSSREFLNAIRDQVQAQLQSQQAPTYNNYANTDDFLRFGDQPQASQDNIEPPSDLLSLLGITQADFAAAKRSQNGMTNNKNVAQSYHNWNLEAEYLKVLATTDQRFNKPFGNDMGSKNSDFLTKRPLETEPKEKKKFKLMKLGSIEDPSFGNSSIRFETPSGPMFSDHRRRSNVYKDPKKESFGLGSDIDLMNFNMV